MKGLPEDKSDLADLFKSPDESPDWIQRDPQYQKLKRIRDTFIPVPHMSYGWLLSSSIDEYEAVAASTGNIDEKADRVFRHLAIAAGIIGVGFSAMIERANIWTQLVLMVGLVLAIAAIGFAFLVRKPMNQHYRIATSDVLFLLNYYKWEEYAKGYAALVIAVAAQGRTLINERKARHLGRAYRFAFFSIAVFVVGLPFAIFWGSAITGVGCGPR